jgi:hypothetical protein
MIRFASTHISTKFRTILNPTGPDFSGWNCTPKTLSASSAAV